MSQTHNLQWAVLAIVITAIRSGCKKDEDPAPQDPVPATVAVDEIDTALLSILDALPDTVLDPDVMMVNDSQSVEAVLQQLDPGFLTTYEVNGGGERDGLTGQQQKDLLVARMALIGRKLAKDSEHTYPMEGPDKPAQTGLAYGYGSKFYDDRRIPAAGQCQSEYIYALDCSGMVYTMGEKSALVFPYAITASNVARMKDLAFWTDALPAEYPSVTAVDMGTGLALEDHLPGDVIIWNGHVGQVVVDGNTGQKYICQSNGTGNAANNGCELNKAPNRGPSMKPLNAAWLNTFGSVQHVVRFTPNDNDCGAIVSDIEGNEYAVVNIFGQCWMAENLRTGTFSNGDPIPEVLPND